MSYFMHLNMLVILSCISQKLDVYLVSLILTNISSMQTLLWGKLFILATFWALLLALCLSFILRFCYLAVNVKLTVDQRRDIDEGIIDNQITSLQWHWEPVGKSTKFIDLNKESSKIA